ncbi:hypothetical protein SUGI_0330250 [Cryptomeria japonica]|nr:hypothetical protein SUGI_0330250 [Cryptomeria japonica]
MPGVKTSKGKGKIVSQTSGLEGKNENEDTHQVMKNFKVFKSLFESLEPLSLRNINNKEWGCPACKGGDSKVKVSDRYKGIQGLIEHAKVTKSCNVGWHQKLVKVLEEEVKRRKVACTMAQHVYGKWLGLENACGECEIVWPPIIIIQNTNLDLSDNQQRAMGMGNKELLDCFKQYKPSKAKFAYGQKGHCGVSLLIFEDSIDGYLEADYLHRNFLRERRGRDNWNEYGMPNQNSSGKRILYGYMATSEDMEDFNKHSTKAKVKYDMVPYQLKVIEPVKKMKEENGRITWLEKKIDEDRESTKYLEEKVNDMIKRLDIQQQEMKILMAHAYERDEDCKKGYDFLENFYKQQIDQLKEGGKENIQKEKIGN